MAVQLKKTKPKKEKLAKAPKAPKAEKPAKITAVKIKKEKSIKVKREKPVKVTKDKTKKSSPKIEKTRSSVSIDGVNDKQTKAKRVKVIVAVTIIVVIAALIAVGISLYVKHANAVAADGQNISKVYISAYPKKVTYHIGDTIPDYTGLKIGVSLKNGTEHFVEYSEENASDFTFKGFDCSAYSDEQKVTVYYKGYECYFNIVVREKPQETPVLERISLETLPKTEYKVGEWLSTTGGVILLEYSNRSPLRVNLMNKDVYGWEEAYEAGPGTYTLKVLYVENGALAETTYEITITE